MFGNLGVHIIKNPAGTYSYVGTLPVVLASIVPATMADTLAGRSFFDAHDNLMAYKFPVFATREDALAHAAAFGVEVIAD